MTKRTLGKTIFVNWLTSKSGQIGHPRDPTRPNAGVGDFVMNATKITIRHARNTGQNVSGLGYTSSMKENKKG